MTGRRLYEIVTDELRRKNGHKRYSWEDGNEGGVVVGNFESRTPAAFAYLLRGERDAWNAAAKRVSGKR